MNPPRGRFYTLAAELAKRPDVRDPRRLAAWIERHAAKTNKAAGMIGRQVTAVEYREPSKGAGVWRHDFTTRGVRLTAEADGSLRIAKPGAALHSASGGHVWADNPPRGRHPYELHGRTMRVTVAGRRYEIPDWWLVGATHGGRSIDQAIERWVEQARLAEQFERERKPNRKGRHMAKRKRRPPAGYSSWSSWSAAMRRRQTSHHHTNKAKKGGKAVAKRRNDPGRKHHSGKKRTTYKVRHVVYRNAPSGRGIMGFVKGAPKAIAPIAGVLAGKIAARALPAYVLKTPPVGMKGLGVQFGAGLAASLAVNFVAPTIAFWMLVGTGLAVAESALRGVNLAAAGQPPKGIPIVAAALSDRTELYSLSGYYFGPGRRTGVGEYLSRSPARPLGDSGEGMGPERSQLMVFG